MKGGRRAKPSGSKDQVVVFLEMTEDRALVPKPVVLMPGRPALRGSRQEESRFKVGLDYNG